jgi:hypothetical protein
VGGRHDLGIDGTPPDSRDDVAHVNGPRARCGLKCAGKVPTRGRLGVYWAGPGRVLGRTEAELNKKSEPTACN